MGNKKKTLKIQPSNEIRDVTMTVKDFLRREKGFAALKEMGVKRGKGSDRMQKFISIMTEQFNDIAQTKNDLAAAHGEKMPNGDYVIDPEKDKKSAAIYVAEMEALLDERVHITLRPPSLDCLGGNTIPGAVTDLRIFMETTDEDEIPEKEKESRAS